MLNETLGRSAQDATAPDAATNGARPKRRRRFRFRLTDPLVVLAGADRRVLRKWSVDRSYFVGMGVALLLAATISTVSLMEATSIAFHAKFRSTPVIVAGCIYFVLLLGVDRWLVSDPTAGFATDSTHAAAATFGWFRHAITETFRVAPRLLIAVVSSWLFAIFILLAVFNPEIQQQLKKIGVQQQAEYTLAVQAQANTTISDAQQIIDNANNAIGSLRTNFNSQQRTELRLVAEKQAAIQKLEAKGFYCYSQPIYATETNAQGQLITVLVRYQEVCPPPIQQVLNTYNPQIAKYKQTPAALNRQINTVNKNYGVPGQERIIKNAKKRTEHLLATYKPAPVDGLLDRMKALGLLTTAPAGACPATPTTADLANDAACVSEYSPNAASLHTWLRLWLLGFELLPIVLKYVNSLLPRRAYASMMAAKDEKGRSEARARISELHINERTRLAIAERVAHVKVEEEGALREFYLRELAKLEGRMGIRNIGARVAAAIKGADPWSGRGQANDKPAIEGPAIEGTVLPLGYPIDPDNKNSDPGRRVIESEDFLDFPS